MKIARMDRTGRSFGCLMGKRLTSLHWCEGDFMPGWIEHDQSLVNVSSNTEYMVMNL